MINHGNLLALLDMYSNERLGCKVSQFCNHKEIVDVSEVLNLVRMYKGMQGLSDLKFVISFF